LGEVGKGHKVAFCTLNVGRLKLSTYAAGGARGAVEVAARYAGERVQFGRPIGEFGMIQRKLADMASRAYAAESVAYRASGLVYQALEAAAGVGRPSLDEKLDTLSEFSIECAMAKVFASEAYNHLSDEAVQVFGGYGFSEEYPPAHMYRDSRITRIYEGTNEICRLYAQRATMKKAWAGGLDLKDAFAGLAVDVRPAIGTGNGVHMDAFDTYAPVIRGLRKVYLYLVAAVGDAVDHDEMFDADNQQLVASLADVAIEIFAAESIALRVAKACDAGADHVEMLEALVRIGLARAADRTRQEANEILGALFAEDALASRLAEIAGWLPLPPGLIEDRARVARALLELRGLPAGEAQGAR
jgi:alkylation response protein AidB-like acyl-CoA dehydrogenase